MTCKRLITILTILIFAAPAAPAEHETEYYAVFLQGAKDFCQPRPLVVGVEGPSATRDPVPASQALSPKSQAAGPKR